MFKAIREFFGIFGKTETTTVVTKVPETTSVSTAVKPANKAVPKKRGPAKKSKNIESK